MDSSRTGDGGGAIGSYSRPLESVEEMKVAKALLAGEFAGEGGRRGLWRYRGGFWQWVGTRWVERTTDEMFSLVYQAVEDFHVRRPTESDPDARVRYKPTATKVDGLLRALGAASESPFRKPMPMWIEHPGGDLLEASQCIAFQDVVIEVTKAGVRTRERGPEWFDNCVLPVAWDEEAECPTWERCLREWGDGSEEWGELLQRWMGYCLMGTRKYERWMLLQGKVRAGKGTIAWVLKQLAGESAFYGISLGVLGSKYGVGTIQNARILSIGETHKLDRGMRQEVAGNLKGIVGRDGLSADLKYQDVRTNVVVNAAVMVSSNEIPNMSDDNQGLSSKALVLPFRNSFLGRERFDLRERLGEELAGIARWCVEGALKLEQGVGGCRWPMTEEGRRTLGRYRVTSNPLNAFLGARFIEREEGFVRSEWIKKEYEDWCKKNEVRERVAPNLLLLRLETESGWSLERSQMRVGEGRRFRGLKGLVLRKETEDEVD